MPKPESTLPSNVARYVTAFDAEVPDDDMQSPNFRRRFLFTPIITNKRGQADEIIEFVHHDSELGKMIGEAREKVIFKEVEKVKHLPSQIVRRMNDEGYVRFKIHHHTKLWKNKNAKRAGTGYGVNVAGTWYWYDLWLREVRRYCSDNSELFVSTETS